MATRELRSVSLPLPTSSTKRSYRLILTTRRGWGAIALFCPLVTHLSPNTSSCFLAVVVSGGRSQGAPDVGLSHPGHPEYGHTDHVEITTGPLGQGIASATGFAYAQRFERGLFDPDAAPGESPFDHFVYVIAGDGDLQEGVSAEAASLAGHQELGNLVVLYDANQISIEDDVDIAFSEDVAARYEAYGWHVQTVDFGPADQYTEDVDALLSAITAAQMDTGRPSLIVMKTIIGWPSRRSKTPAKFTDQPSAQRS